MKRHPTTLYVCRHADAVDPEETGDLDEDRWLTEEGRRRALAVGEALRASHDLPALILTSPLVRAVQTAEGVARGLGYAGDCRVLRSLATGGSVGRVFSDLAEHARHHHSLLIVGHEPQMSAIAATAMGRPFHRAFSKAGVLRLDFHDAPLPGTGVPAFFLHGKGLERESV